MGSAQRPGIWEGPIFVRSCYEAVTKLFYMICIDLAKLLWGRQGLASRVVCNYTIRYTNTVHRVWRVCSVYVFDLCLGCFILFSSAIENSAYHTRIK